MTAPDLGRRWRSTCNPPPYGVRVLVLWRGEVEEAIRVRTDELGDWYKCWRYNDGAPVPGRDRVTYWMPLPASPTEARSDD